MNSSSDHSEREDRKPPSLREDKRKEEADHKRDQKKREEKKRAAAAAASSAAPKTPETKAMPKKAKAAKAMSDPPGIWHWEQRDQDRGRRRDHQDRDRSRRGLGGGGGGNGNGGGGTGGGGKGGDGNGGDGNDRDGYSHYRSWSPVTAPPAGEGWSGGWSRDRGGRGWQQSQHNNWWSRQPGGQGPQREERNERKEKEWAGEPRLLSRDEAVIERNWLRCVACNKTFKCQYSFDQHYRDKHQSQAPQPRDPWKAAEAPVHEVPSSAADGITPDESISQVMFRQDQVQQAAAVAAAVAAVEGQGGPRRMPRKKADRGAAAADHARPMPMRGAHGPQTDGPGYMGQGYVGRVGPDTVAALASLQGEPAGPPPPPGPATSSAAASSSSRQEALANFLQSMGAMVRAMDDPGPSGPPELPKRNS